MLSLLLRIAIALATRTSFQPDEYYQSLEPAHRLVFGYGSLTWEWLNPRPIRSIVYPALNVPLYWVLNATGIAEMGAFGDWLLIACPKVLHGTLAALTDIWLCHLTRRVLGERHVSTALFLSLTCFFHALSLSRSLSNSLETSLTTIALAHYPWDASTRLSPNVYFKPSDLRTMLIFGALACTVRPTNAIIWVFLIPKLLWVLWPFNRLFKFVIQEALVIGICAISAMILLDSLYYGELVITHLNFFLTNMSSVSSFYGSSPWHYYLSQGLPILCTTALPFVMHGIWTSIQSKKAVALQTMAQLVLWTIGIYSLAGHKEWRFIHPILPLLHIFAAKSLDDLTTARPLSKQRENDKRTGKPGKGRSPVPKLLTRIDIPISLKYLVWLTATVPLSLYAVLFYGSAPISAMSYLRSLPRETLRNSTIGILMPCHSLPGQAYLHRPELASGRLWALGCEPPLLGQDLNTYHDQTDVFYASPISYLRTYFPPKVDTSFPLSPYPTTPPGVSAEPLEERYSWRHEWPSHLIFFGTLLDQDGVKGSFVDQGYTEVWRGGRSWEGDSKRRGGIRIWKWDGGRPKL